MSLFSPEESFACKLWRRHIHLSSWYSRFSLDPERPDSKIKTFMSPSSWFWWKCSAISEFLGRFFISYRCFPNRVQIASPVWPTQTQLWRIHTAAYMTFLVWHVPPSFNLIFIPRFSFAMVSVVRMSLHNLQFWPQGTVVLGFLILSSFKILFLTIMFLIVLGRRYATIGLVLKISLLLRIYFREFRKFSIFY